MNLWLGQFFGMVSFGLGIFCFYQRDDKLLKRSMLAMNFCNIPHFWLLDANTAALSSLVSVLRTGASLRASGLLWALGFMLVAIFLSLPFIQHPYHWLAIIGSCIGSYALFCLKGIAMRTAFLLGACCWLGNNIAAGSIGGTLLEIMLISINGRTTYKLISEQKKGLKEAKNASN